MGEKILNLKHSLSGSSFDKTTFLEWSKISKVDGKPYSINMMKLMNQLRKSIQDKIGNGRGKYVFIKSITWDLAFHKPIWKPELFNIDNEDRKKFYKKIFKEFQLFIILFDNLKKEMAEEEADRFIAEQMLPITLYMMKSKFRPVSEINSVDVWLKQARNYLGDEVKENKGFEGDIYLSKDKSEVRFQVTRCANMEILRKYGLRFTAATLCMCDHITYHTVFPNLIFKRTHSIAVGDEYCDHEFRLRTKDDPKMDEDNYGDCYTIDGIRDVVREWEEKAKEIHFGSKMNWDKYANKYFENNEHE